jgi:phosphate transport system substrate-binding protein
MPPPAGGFWKEHSKVKVQRKNSLRSLAAGTVAISSALGLTACGSDNNSSWLGGGARNPTVKARIQCDGKGRLLASGSTAQRSAMDLWVKNYTQACPDVQINYKSVGSGAGIEEFLQGETAFAGSDETLRPDEVAKSKQVCSDGKGIALPMVGGDIAVGYNLPGVNKLVLDAPTLAKIFDSKITEWNDLAIKKLNPGVNLPPLQIQAFHRADESGTTQNFTDYLAGAAPSDWKYETDKTWHAKGGQSAYGSSVIASQVDQTEGAIGYFDLSYVTALVNNIKTIDIDTGASKPVPATSDTASAGIAAAKIVGRGKDVSLELNYATKAEGAYPIVLVTYEIVCDMGNKSGTLAAMKSFLAYAASEDGQKVLKDAGYASLPTVIAKEVRATIRTLS